ncbi:7 transmembrane sweet-taste receptor of 3 GCPR-domain-containing protein [Spinellus fusiger]|nr:7 transmembrane sweet-taste receptor of 3 GCPR-domain-containing protein [Spinellus fusiger]
MIGIPTQLSCIVSPLVFNLGFLLVLGNMIAKNYRIYRIFNNIFITRTVITDLQLVKTVSVIVGLDMIIICIGLVVTKPVPTLYTVSVSNHFWICESQSSNKIVFTVLLAIYASGLLIFATFLAYKTRLANRQYTHYSECRQMGLSVYNILFSVLVGFAVVVNPMADFFTKYYITVITILWATTFSLLILFFPKLQAFYLYYKKEHSAMAKDAKHKEQHMLHPVLNSSHSMALRSPNHGENELMSLDRLLANDTVFLDSDPSGQRKASLVSAYLELSSPTGSPNYVEVHEVSFLFHLGDVFVVVVVAVSVNSPCSQRIALG